MPGRHPLLRRLPTAVAALAALLWLVTVLAYARSCFVADVLRWTDAGPPPRRAERRHTVSLSAGVVEVYSYEERRAFVLRRPPGSPPRVKPLEWDVTRAMDPYEGRPVRSVWNRLGFRNDHWAHPFGSEHLVVVPLWPLLVGFAAVAVAWDLRRRAALRSARADSSATTAGAADEGRSPPPTGPGGSSR